MEKRDNRLIPPGTKLKDVPWKKLISEMRKKVDESGRRLLEKRHTTDMRLEKKLGMMRLALLQQMHAKLRQEVDARFFLDVIELISRAEELLEQYEHDVSDWLEFLELLEKKLEEEGMLLGDEEALEQGRRLRGAIDKLRRKLEEKGPFKPLE